MTETTEPRYAFVMGVDPGTTTGLSMVRFDMQWQGRPEAVWSDQLGWTEACVRVKSRIKKLAEVCRDEKALAVAVAPEQFTINAQTAQRGQKGADDALGMLGVVREWCEVYGVEMGPRETASAAKNLISDAVLRLHELWYVGGKHANDATRHALLLAIKRKWMAKRFLVEAS